MNELGFQHEIVVVCELVKPVLGVISLRFEVIAESDNIIYLPSRITLNISAVM